MYNGKLSSLGENTNSKAKFRNSQLLEGRKKEKVLQSGLVLGHRGSCGRQNIANKHTLYTSIAKHKL